MELHLDENMDGFDFLIVALVVLIPIMTIIWLLSRRRIRKNEVLREEILSTGKKAEASVISATLNGEVVYAGASEKKAIVRGEFRVRILDTGEEYKVLKWIDAPYQVLSDFREGHVFSVMVKKDNPLIMVFDFDRTRPARDIKITGSLLDSVIE